MASTVIKNWDKENWLSSKNYILNFNKFLLKVNKLDSSSKILDIGCGRGKIIGALSSKLKLKKLKITLQNRHWFSYSQGLKHEHFFLPNLRKKNVEDPNK